MSYPSRSHRGRYRRVTVPFEYYSQVIATPRLSGWVASRAVYQPAEQCKDKGGEKLAETEEDLLQHRTDGTDAFDTLYIGCAKFSQQTTSTISFSGVS